MWGFVLMARSTLIEFYSMSLYERDQWVDSLRNYVVFLDVKEDYNIRRLIGSGNFAKVHLCQQKRSPYNKYALKTIGKSNIRSSQKNLVSAQDIELI